MVTNRNTSKHSPNNQVTRCGTEGYSLVSNWETNMSAQMNSSDTFDICIKS